MARMVSFVVLIVILLLIGALFFKVIAGFLLPLFLAALLVVMFQPLHAWIATRCKGRDGLAAGLTTMAILLIVLAPLFWILAQAAGEASHLIADWNQQAVLAKLDKLRTRFDLKPLPASVQEQMQQVDESLLAMTHESDAGAIEGLAAQAATSVRAIQAEAPAGQTEAQLASLERVARELETLTRLDPEADLAGQLGRVADAWRQYRQELSGNPLRQWLRQKANPDKEDWSALRLRLQGAAGPLALGTTQFVGAFVSEALIGLIIMVVSLYYFLVDGPAMIASFMKLSPLDDKYEAQLLEEFSSVSRAVVVATLLSAFVQGLLAGVGYFFSGMEAVFLLIMLTMLFALIPFVGAAAIWGGCALWLFFVEERTTAAISLAVYGAVVVSMADNVIKPWVLKGKSNLHPLLALLSVLGGVQAMGPIGILVGPMVVAFLQSLLKMFQQEVQAIERGGASKLSR